MAFRHKKLDCLFALIYPQSCVVNVFFLSSGQNICRFGVGNYDWKEFVPRLKQKTYDEIKEY